MVFVVFEYDNIDTGVQAVYCVTYSLCVDPEDVGLVDSR